MKPYAKYAVILFCTLAVLATPIIAQERGTKAEAEELVKKTIEAIKTEGTEKVYAAISAKDTKFIDRDLYPVVYDIDGTCLAHGSNAQFVGKSMIDKRDADGVIFVKERIEKAKTTKSFWQDYKFINPMTKKIEAKQAFCEVLDETIVCAGAYKAQ